MRLAWTLLLLFLLSGCGYTLNHRVKPVFTDPRGVFVPVFDNLTDEVGAEVVFSNALVRELQSRRQIKLSSNRGGSLVLRGTLKHIDVQPTTLTDLGFKGLASYQRLPSEIGVRVTIDLELRDPRMKKVVWKKTFSGFRRVEAPIDRTSDQEAPSATGLITQSLWRSQYSDIARLIMRDVYDEMVEVF